MPISNDNLTVEAIKKPSGEKGQPHQSCKDENHADSITYSIKDSEGQEVSRTRVFMLAD